MVEEKHKIEALLFSAARHLTLDELRDKSGIKEDEKVKNYLLELQKDYNDRNGPLRILNESGSWKMNVKEDFLPLIQSVVSLAEFEKPLMETLAVIAWKYPSLQSDVIRIRHNKAYDHLRELEERGFITRSKYGRTKKITLTQKFFEYFDLPNREKAQEAFREQLPEDIKTNVEEVERQIEESEKVIEEVKIKKEEEEKAKKEAEKAKVEGKDGVEPYDDDKEVDLVDDIGRKIKLEEYDTKTKKEDLDEYGDRIGEEEEGDIAKQEDDTESDDDEKKDEEEGSSGEKSESSEEVEDGKEKEVSEEEKSEEGKEKEDVAENSGEDKKKDIQKEQEDAVEQRIQQMLGVKKQIEEAESSKDEFDEEK